MCHEAWACIGESMNASRLELGLTVLRDENRGWSSEARCYNHKSRVPKTVGTGLAMSQLERQSRKKDLPPNGATEIEVRVAGLCQKPWHRKVE